MTPFRKKVFQALKKIPRGRVTTYGAIATEIGCPSARAVGAALRHNPDAPAIPCHRVVATDGALTGYIGLGRNLDKKRTLLEKEGITFTPEGKVHRKHFCNH